MPFLMLAAMQSCLESRMKRSVVAVSDARNKEAHSLSKFRFGSAFSTSGLNNPVGINSSEEK